MTFPQGLPIVGKNEHGEDVNLLIKNDGTANTAASVNTMSAANTATDDNSITEVTAMVKTDNGVFAVGTQTDSNQKISSTAWLYDGATWTTGSSPTTAVRPVAISYANSKYLIGDGVNLYSMSFTNRAGKLVNQSEKVPSKIDCITSSSSLSVGSSLSSIGVWTNSGGLEWKHNGLGIPKKVYTGHLSTSFTFPGYSGANATVQRIDAYPYEDAPPDVWNICDDNAQAYYGLFGAPTLTVTWPEA